MEQCYSSHPQPSLLTSNPLPAFSSFPSSPTSLLFPLFLHSLHAIITTTITTYSSPYPRCLATSLARFLPASLSKDFYACGCYKIGACFASLKKKKRSGGGLPFLHRPDLTAKIFENIIKLRRTPRQGVEVVSLEPPAWPHKYGDGRHTGLHVLSGELCHLRASC